MNKRQIIVALCALGLATSALAVGNKMRLPATNQSIASAFSQRSESTNSSQLINTSNSSVGSTSSASSPAGVFVKKAEQTTHVPTPVAYGMLFREITAFKKEAKNREDKGQPGDFIRNHHKEKFKLDNFKDKELERIALKADLEAKKIDEKAKKIIANLRARNPKGVVRPGERLPEPPAELKTLQSERDQVVMDAREQLRQSFGDYDFQSFDEAVQQDIANKTRPVTGVNHGKAGEPRPEQPRP